MSAHFVAIVTGDPGLGYRARFPDLPDCHPAGGGLPEVLVNAQSAALARLQAMAAAGLALPVATPVEQMSVAPGALALQIEVPFDFDVLPIPMIDRRAA